MKLDEFVELSDLITRQEQDHEAEKTGRAAITHGRIDSIKSAGKYFPSDAHFFSSDSSFSFPFIVCRLAIFWPADLTRHSFIEFWRHRSAPFICRSIIDPLITHFFYPN
jgi:hypothetical protein